MGHIHSLANMILGIIIMAGYYYRAEARKKIGDRKGAELDEFKVMKMQLDKRNNTHGRKV